MSYIHQDRGSGGKPNEDAMEVIDRYVDGLKRKKTQAKAAYTRTRRKLMALIDSDLPSGRQIREALQQTDDVQQVAQEIMSEIAGKYKLSNDLKNVQNVTGEMEDIEKIKTSHKKSSNILELKKR